MWKYIGAGAHIAGVPLEDMSDEEFAAREAWYDAQFTPEQAGSLRRCGLYEQLTEKRPRAVPEPASEEAS